MLGHDRTGDELLRRLEDHSLDSDRCGEHGGGVQEVRQGDKRHGQRDESLGRIQVH